MQVCMCEHVCRTRRDQKSMLGVFFFYSSPPYFFEISSYHWAQSSPFSARLASQQTLGPPGSSSPWALALQMPGPHTWLLCGGWGYELRSSGLCRVRSTPPAPRMFSFRDLCCCFSSFPQLQSLDKQSLSWFRSGPENPLLWPIMFSLMDLQFYSNRSSLGFQGSIHKTKRSWPNYMQL